MEQKHLLGVIVAVVIIIAVLVGVIIFQQGGLLRTQLAPVGHVTGRTGGIPVLRPDYVACMEEQGFEVIDIPGGLFVNGRSVTSYGPSDPVTIAHGYCSSIYPP